MCGIAGIFDFSGDSRILVNDLEQMIGSLRHRGPDQVAAVAKGNAGIAFARLSIKDFDHGMQPVTACNGLVTSICNGAIVNWRELRAELEARGHAFQSQCDTEVVAGAFAVHGRDFATKLQGQFAAAVHDRRDDSLTLARDPFGICPLFYTVVGRTLLFASEIKALLAHPAVPREVDLTGVDQVLTFPGPVSPRTLFEGIHSLAPGHCLRVSMDGTVNQWPYWDLSFRTETAADQRSEEDWLEELDTLLTRSIARRMEADVPVGLYLSGGLDSSLVGAKARALANGGFPLHSYSIDVRAGALSEVKYQRLVSKFLQTNHKEISLSAADILQRLRAVVYHTETPIRESFNAATFALSEEVTASGQRLVLAGEGADELFAGYVGYRFDQSGMRRDLPPHEAALSERLWGDAQFVYEGPLMRVSAINKSLFAPELRQAYDNWSCLNYPPVNVDRLKGLDRLQRRSYLDTKLRLGDHLLSGHGDRMALAHSVEVRYPFLDADVAEFASRLPSHLKLHHLNEKYLLKQLAARHLLPALAKREKFAFTAPGSPTLLAQGSDLVDHLLDSATIRRQGYFDVDEVQRLRVEYSQPGFRLNAPFERDVLLVVLTFGLFLEAFDMPNVN
ncbi:MAG TPA: asparagine synthase (glutamine-hydrolyzing) [Candidatus Angelobacter sp.]|jgi:asparagine synthase (glutamine-hydrolysing)|nr:asparagine synthase (glutamine-hydrolyzing) [Candidatus Angelobacter sp.]